MSAGPADTGKHTDVIAETRVRDVVRDVVAEVAPAELPVVEGLCAFDDHTVARRLNGPGRRRERLGFGWNEIATLATPVVWLVVNQAARQVGTAAGKGATTGAKTLLRKLFRRRKDAILPALAPEQLADIREQVRQTAVKRGLGSKRADELADAVYTRLSLTAMKNSTPAQSKPDDSTNTPS